MTIETRLAEIRARAEAATEGPWRASLLDGVEYEDGSSCHRGGIYPSEKGAAPVLNTTNVDRRNAEFIAHARTDLPSLLAAVETVRELHQPGPPYLLDVPEVCEHCSDNEDEREVAYPCQTVQALADALEVQG